MAMIDSAHPAPFGAVTIYRGLVEPVSRFVTWYREQREAAATVRALCNLTPALLKDIGLTEADVAAYRRNSSFF